MGFSGIRLTDGVPARRALDQLPLHEAHPVELGNCRRALLRQGEKRSPENSSPARDSSSSSFSSAAFALNPRAEPSSTPSPFPCPRPLFPAAKALNSIMQLTGIRNKVAAFAIMLVGIALGTLSSLVLIIFLCGGFPLTA